MEAFCLERLKYFWTLFFEKKIPEDAKNHDPTCHQKNLLIKIDFSPFGIFKPMYRVEYLSKLIVGLTGYLHLPVFSYIAPDGCIHIRHSLFSRRSPWQAQKTTRQPLDLQGSEHGD